MPPKRTRSEKRPGKSPGKDSGKTSPGKSRPHSARRKGGSPFAWRLTLALVLCVSLLIGLIWLAKHEGKPVPKTVTVPPAAELPDRLPVARELVEAFFAGSNIPAGSIVREPPGAPRDYRVHHRAPKAGPVDALRRKLHEQTPPLLLNTPEDGVFTIADQAGKLLLSIQFLPTLPLPAEKPGSVAKGGRVAIIVDDLGRALPQARKLLAMAQPVTFSILPGEPHSLAVANAANAVGREVMLHAPMEPQGYPVVDPGDDALLLSQDDGSLHESMAALLTRVPHAVGVNNHMGSRFTEDERGMRIVMQVLKEKHLFFVDSLTSSHSVGSRMAESVGVASARRDLFLDNVAEVGAIVREIERLAEKARRNGGAIGICHPYPETLAALQQELPHLAREGIEFVKVSELLAGR